MTDDGRGIGKNVVVTGGAGFLGRHVCALLEPLDDVEVFVPRRIDFDLTVEADTHRLFETAFDGEPVDTVIHLAAEVGGIGANRANPGRYFFANMAMALHLIEGARRHGMAERGGSFVQVGTVCSYPKFADVPFSEDQLFGGYPEETNAPYGIAKRAAWQMLDAYHRQYGLRSAYVLPVNLYGPHDNFDLETSHVIPALIRKTMTAIADGDDHIEVWGSGAPTREFLYVDDAARGILAAAARMSEPTPINLGTEQEISIRDLVGLIAEVVGFEGEFVWNTEKPDGQPRRQLDTTRARELLGWTPTIDLREGLARTVAWWRDHGE